MLISLIVLCAQGVLSFASKKQGSILFDKVFKFSLKSKEMLIVQKYGGSSLANPKKIKDVARRIIEEKKRNKKLVVVVSAMGDTTDELINMSHQITENPDKRELDMLLSTGEQVSAALLSMAIQDEGFKAISLTGSQVGILTDKTYTKARIKEIDIERIDKELSEDKIVIVAGFQGITSDEDITTLGRGGSDITAVALAYVLNADSCEIYTDVDGVYTADPRIVPKARKIDVLSYEEMLEMASSGSSVLQTRAVEFAKKQGVVIYLRPSFNNSAGTIICNKEVMSMEGPIISGITTNCNCAKITICGVPDKPGTAGEIFQALADASINVDVIVQSQSPNKKANISFTVDKADLALSLASIEKIRENLPLEEVLSDSDIGKISIVGVGMSSHPGVAAKMFRILGERKINIDMISTSEIKISCIIKKNRLQEAANAIHLGFGL